MQDSGRDKDKWEKLSDHSMFLGISMFFPPKYSGELLMIFPTKKVCPGNISLKGLKIHWKTWALITLMWFLLIVPMILPCNKSAEPSTGWSRRDTQTTGELVFGDLMTLLRLISSVIGTILRSQLPSNLNTTFTTENMFSLIIGICLQIIRWAQLLFLRYLEAFSQESTTMEFQRVAEWAWETPLPTILISNLWWIEKIRFWNL